MTAASTARSRRICNRLQSALRVANSHECCHGARSLVGFFAHCTFLRQERYHLWTRVASQSCAFRRWRAVVPMGKRSRVQDVVQSTWSRHGTKHRRWVCGLLRASKCYKRRQRSSSLRRPKGVHFSRKRVRLPPRLARRNSQC